MPVVVADPRVEVEPSRRSAVSTSKCSRSSVDAGVADLLGDEDARHRASRSTTQSMQAVSARTSSGSIAGNIADAQLVAPELAVGLGVDDAVGAQRRGDRGGVDLVVEVDRADDERALGRVGDERRRERRDASAQP